MADLKGIVKRLRFLLFLLSLSLFTALEAQPEEAEANPADTRVEALSSLLVALDSVESEVGKLRTELAGATTGADRDRLEEEFVERTVQLDELRKRFRESAAGIDLSLFEKEEKEAFSWEQTLGKILEPILDEVEKATATSRKRSELLAEEDLYSEQAAAAHSALERIDQTLVDADDPVLRAALQVERELWEERHLLAENRYQAAALQLAELDAGADSFVGGTTSFIRGFLAERGLNLLVGIFSALLVFFGLRLLLVLMQKLRTGEQPGSFGSRIFLLLTNLLSIVGAVTALLIAFSAAGDLFLLGIVLVFLIGAAWAGIQVIPQFIESLKIILNIGMVRENERILFDGIPWHVEVLGFSCTLVNPNLDSARQVLPVRRLVGLHSRPWCEDELPFPCQRGEWVELSDGTIGQSVSQNPGTVTLREWGGAEVTFQTPGFLDQSPRNLTREGFQVESRFGIDYAHQEIATTDVPGWFGTALRDRLPSVVDAACIRDIHVHFASAGASSLDYVIRVNLSGEAAELYRDIEYAIQRILVEACNEHTLSIPFQQITIHRAPGSPS